MTTLNSRTKAHRVIQTMGLLYNVTNSVSAAQSMLRQVQMINNFGQVIEEHSVSAPIIATMRAVPEFEAASSNFPDATLYNQVPSHRTSERYTAAMESFGEIAETKINGLMTSTADLAQSVVSLIDATETIGNGLKSQILQYRLALESSDITDDEIFLLQTNSITDDAFGQVLAGLEGFYDTASPFNVDTLRANPEQLAQELEGLSAFSTELGQTLGFTLTDTGLEESAKGSDFMPTQGDFEQKGFSKAGLLFTLDRLDSLCDNVMSLSARRDEFVNAIVNEAKDIPESLNSDDVTYGATEHVTLMCCYATMLSKSIKETVNLTSDLLMAIDPILDSIESGEAAIESIAEVAEVESAVEEEAPTE